MDVTTKGLALRATDYKENDKLVALYTPDYGKITVHARGVRKSTAKLRFAVDQFCFGDYELAATGDRYTLKNCQQISSFYGLREDIVVYYAACCVAECLLSCTEEGQSDPVLFVETLRALEALADGRQPLVVTARFVTGFLELSGFRLDFTRCSVCGKKTRHMYVDMQRGVTCDGCRGAESIAVSPIVATSLAMIDGVPYDKLDNFNFTLDCQKDMLQLLNRYIAHVFYPSKSMTELIRLA